MADAPDVLVTGAGRGLGRGVALAFAQAGWRTWIVSNVPDEIAGTAATVRAAGGDARPLVADLATREGCGAVVEMVTGGADRLRAVVNNAAVLCRTPVEDLPTGVWDEALAVNLTAPFLLARGVLPLLAGGGSIINVSSRAGVHAFPGEAAYCASKFGLEALSACMALELRGRPISVNTITPGARIKPTSLTERDALALPEHERSGWIDPVTLGPAFVFLAGLRGEVSGRRFDASRLADALAREGVPRTRARIDELHE